ncbi:hypothetical protein PYW07_004911 [Mythimna separata]|uniref:Odorant receptor n=2 Tax=Mythimna separata TaxID=271217 RepID=A0A7H1DHA2_MYTSE|nr:hypothetical protein PYW07_004911 [Mythimna separata]QNS36228.1 olfactory receptor 37 [Mythimna separata]
MELWQQIRKFGLEYCDLPTMLWNVSVFLKLLTLNIYGKNKSGIPFIFYIIMIAALLCYFYVYFFSVFWFVIVRSPQTGDMVAAMVVLSLGISSEIGILKLLYMFLYIDNIRGLTDAFLDFDALTTPGSRQASNLLRYMRDVKKRAIFYWMVLMVNGTIYVFMPLAIPGRHLTEDLCIIYGLEPMFESPNYEIASIMMASSVYTICYISANVTCYLIVVIGYVESQMLTLSDEVTHIWTDAEEHYNKVSGFGIENFLTNYDRKYRIMNDHVCKNLKDIIKCHATIKTLLNQVEDVCRGPIAVGFILLVLGIIFVLLGGLENTMLQLPFVFIQVGIDCFIGQRVMDAGLIFDQALYNCKWENFDKKNMKMVLVMLQASKKPTAISAGGFTQMSFKCMMMAMRATYSAYTTIRSVMK